MRAHLSRGLASERQAGIIRGRPQAADPALMCSREAPSFASGLPHVREAAFCEPSTAGPATGESSGYLSVSELSALLAERASRNQMLDDSR